MTAIDHTTPLAAGTAPGTCTVRSTTGTAPITFTAVEPGWAVRIDLEDGSSQVYDRRAVSRALFEASIGTTVAEFSDLVRASTGTDTLGYGPALGYEPAWCDNATTWEHAPDEQAWRRVARRHVGGPVSGVRIEAVQTVAADGTTTHSELEVVLPGGRTVLGVEELEEVGRALLEAAQLLAGYDPTPIVMHPAGTARAGCPAWCQTDHHGIDAPEQHDGPTWVPVPATGGYRSAQVSAGAREDGGMVVYLEAPGLILSAADARTAGNALLAAAYWADDHDAGAR